MDENTATAITASLPQPIWEYLLIIALTLFMMDVIVRRVILTREDLGQVWSAVIRDSEGSKVATGRLRLLVLEQGARAGGEEIRGLGGGCPR